MAVSPGLLAFLVFELKGIILTPPPPTMAKVAETATRARIKGIITMPTTVSVSNVIISRFQCFEVISPSPAGPRPLNEHKREVRAVPRDKVPALYADLTHPAARRRSGRDQPDQPAAGRQSSGTADAKTPGQDSGVGRRLGARRRRPLEAESQPVVDTMSFAEAVTMARGEPKMTCRVAQPREDALHGPGSPAAARLVTFTAAACFSLLSRRSSTHSAGGPAGCVGSEEQLGVHV